MLIVEDLGLMDYRQAWALQESVLAKVADGAAERLLLVEHPPVITLGRRPPTEAHLLATRDELAGAGVEVVHSDRGGDITFHGPGQLVAYPIIRLIDHRLSVGGYVRMLEHSVIAALAELGVAGGREPGAVGVWTQNAKICAIGVRIRRGVSMHGLALNVDIDLSRFDLIVPCGLSGRSVNSLRRVLGERAPSMAKVKSVLTGALRRSLAPVELPT
jgi:lipoyl(octanoyl) transferase